MTGLWGTMVPALNERSSKKLSRSAANFKSALSKSSSVIPLNVLTRPSLLRLPLPLTVLLLFVIVELLEVDELRIRLLEGLACTGEVASTASPTSPIGDNGSMVTVLSGEGILCEEGPFLGT